MDSGRGGLFLSRAIDKHFPSNIIEEEWIFFAGGWHLERNLTQLSAQEHARLGSGQMSTALVAQYLRDGGFALRTFPEVLRSLCPGQDLQARLTDAFAADEPEASPATLAKVVRNWLTGKAKPTRREEIFHIAFALGFSEPQADLLLGHCTDYGIHYREGRDVVYAWFLRNGGSYLQARAFFASLPPVPRPDQPPKGAGAQITHEMQSAFLLAHTQEDLRACYLANLKNFGALHTRAYAYFSRYLDRLIHPVPEWTGLAEPDYSMEAVMDLYLRMKMPSSRSRTDMGVIQRLIKSNWPNTTALKNIRNRKADVPRKLLLLFYIITENAADEEYRETDEDYLTPQQRLDDHWYAINAMLTDCGMPPLDPRNAFDWLVLYAVTADEESMSERMEAVIEQLFSGLSE